MVKNVAELPLRIKEAFEIATSGRPGPGKFFRTRSYPHLILMPFSVGGPTKRHASIDSPRSNPNG